MRLQASEIEIIKGAVASAFGDSAVVRLFGSRLHDELKGGDIDLHVECNPLGGSEINQAKHKLWVALYRAFDGRKIDVVVSMREQERSPIEQIAYRDGAIL